MAQVSTFSPEFMAKMATKTQFAAPAAKAISQFAKFPGPPGRYFAKLHKITGSFDTKDGTPIVWFAFVILAYVENNDRTHAGYPVRIRFALKATEKQTEQEAWNRLYTDGYQAMGIATAAWNTDDVLAEMARATEFLNLNKFPVVVSITPSKSDARFQNVNIQEVLNLEAIKHLEIPDVQITDESISQENDAELLPDTAVTDDFARLFKDAESKLAEMNTTQLLTQISEIHLEVENPSELPDNELRRILLRYVVEQSNRDPAEFGLDTSFEVAQSSEALSEALAEELGEERLLNALDKAEGREPSYNEIPDDQTIAEEAAEEEELIEEIDDFPDTPAFSDRVTVLLAPLDRDALKKICPKYGITKLSKSMTDDMVRGMVYDAIMETLDEATGEGEIRFAV